MPPQARLPYALTDQAAGKLSKFATLATASSALLTRLRRRRAGPAHRPARPPGQVIEV